MGETERKNVIVVGAGASQEFGLPTGVELTSKLQELLSFEFDDWGRAKPNGINCELYDGIEALARGSQKPIGHFLESAGKICKNMSLAPSIDNFLDTHKENLELVSVGKLAIATAISQSEKKSNLWIDPSNIYNRLGFDRASETWASVFFKIIAAKRNFESFLAALESITFISFNYDRCIRQFFVNAAMSYFDLEPAEAIRVMEALRVVHPYGSIGDLGIEQGRTSGFGKDHTSDGLIVASERIRTFTEGVSDKNIPKQINLAFENASVVVFLGFSFIDINMKILRPTMCSADRVLATAKGRSADTKKRLAKEIARDYSRYSDVREVHMFDGKCFELFYEFDHYLMSQA